MDPRDLKSILGQGATRAETPRDRAERRTIETDLAESPVKGKPLARRLRNFQVGADAHLVALGGPLAWMRRLREIEELTERHERRLGEEWRALGAELTGRPDEFGRRWRRTAYGWSLADVNERVDQHNRNFPIEARLPMDPRTRDFVRINGKPYRRPLFDASWILERFPPDLERAA